ncbi:hypothetical protein BKA80DRAFT_254174 [Phyllosticta citrichinensis]
MRLLAAGFNAHGQLSPNAGPTISTFSEIARSLPGEPIHVCWAGWSDVVLRIGSRHPRYYWRGHQGELELRVLATQSPDGKDNERDAAPPSLHSFFGTHDGCRGAVTSESKLFLFPEGSKLSDESMTMTCSATDFRCTHVAVNGVGRTVVAVPPPDTHTKTSPTSTRLWEFSSLDEFIAFARRPSNNLPTPPQRPCTSHTISNAPLRALHAGQTFHLAHTASSLESWSTDLRHASSVGRPTDEIPCTSPSPVTGFSSNNDDNDDADDDDDDSTAPAKAATCTNSHLAAALTRDGSAYIWGKHGADDPLDADADSRLALFAAAEADGWSPPDGPLPVAIDALPDEQLVDVAVGAAHVVLLDRTRGVWVAGGDAEGQLGASVAFSTHWSQGI